MWPQLLIKPHKRKSQHQDHPQHLKAHPYGQARIVQLPQIYAEDAGDERQRHVDCRKPGQHFRALAVPHRDGGEEEVQRVRQKLLECGSVLGRLL